jgi:regulatory protein
VSSAPGARRRRDHRPSQQPRDPDSAEEAYAAAVRRLARQPQSRATLGQRLVRAGYAAGAVDAALAQAEARGYLNDAELATALVRRRRMGRGQALIAQELRAKGISDAVISAALADGGEAAEAQRARTVALSMLRGRRPGSLAEVRAQIGPKLSRRGFSSGLISRVCRELVTERASVGEFDTVGEPD